MRGCDLSLFRARATSAAPSYFKAFRSKRNNRGYLDGALYYNNPIWVADLERRLIWPDTELSPPDILLSIGTSCNEVIRQKGEECLHFSRSSRPRAPKKTSEKTTKMTNMISILKNRVENILDTEMTWLKFLSDAARQNKDAENRYKRINPDLWKDPPKLDDINMLPDLRREVRSIMRQGGLKRQIREIARQLVATSFYIESSQVPIHMQESKISVTSKISPAHRYIR